MKFLDEAAARTEIVRLTASSERREFAVAFWGSGAADRLGLAARPAGAQVVCNLAMGGTNPSEIRALLNAGVTVRQADDLHAKVYLFDNAVVLGSSNASSNGLSFQDGDGLGWREANVLIEEPETIRSIEAWLTTLRSRDITEADLEAALEMWRRRRREAKPPAASRSVLGVMKTNPGYFADRGGWLLLYMDEMDPHAKTAFEAIQKAEGEDIDAYQDFPGLPDEGQTLNFWVGARGGVTFDGYWERTRQLTDRPINGGVLNLCLKRMNVLGLHYGDVEKSDWAGLIGRIVRSPLWDTDSRCAAVPLEVVAGFLAETPATKAVVQTDEFDLAMWDLYRRILAETSYKPSDFYGMLKSAKGLLVAKRLLAGPISTGFGRLHELKRPDLTVEALILDARWSSLFAAEELQTARRRLRSAATSKS